MILAFSHTSSSSVVLSSLECRFPFFLFPRCLMLAALLKTRWSIGLECEKDAQERTNQKENGCTFSSPPPLPLSPPSPFPTPPPQQLPYPCRTQERSPGRQPECTRHPTFQITVISFYLHSHYHDRTTDLVPGKRIGHPDLHDQVEDHNNKGNDDATGLVPHGESSVGDGVEGEQVEDSIAKEVGREDSAGHHAGGVAQPGNDLSDKNCCGNVR